MTKRRVTWLTSFQVWSFGGLRIFKDPLSTLFLKYVVNTFLEDFFGANVHEYYCLFGEPDFA